MGPFYYNIRVTIQVGLSHIISRSVAGWVRAAWAGQCLSQLHIQDPDTWGWVRDDAYTLAHLPHLVPVLAPWMSQLPRQQCPRAACKGGLAPAVSTRQGTMLQVLRWPRDHLQAGSGGISLQLGVV